jgi:subtilase family serine protease
VGFRSRLAAPLGAVSLVVAGVGIGTTASAAAPPPRIPVDNVQPSLTAATEAGVPAVGERVQVKVYLADREQADLLAAVRAVSTPGTGQYAKYLTPARFRARYAPSDGTVRQISEFLAGAGLRVGKVPANHGYVPAAGTVAQVQTAFATRLGRYRVGGRTIRAAATGLSVPGTLRGQVLAVSGVASVSSWVRPAHLEGPGGPGGPGAGAPAAAASHPAAAASHQGASSSGTAGAPPPDAFVNAPPCSRYYGEKIATDLPAAYGSPQPYAPCGYEPAQLRGAYGVRSAVAAGNDGHGVRVAITDAYASPTILTDADTYAGRHGQRPFRPGQFTQVLPDSYRYGYDEPDPATHDACGEQGWYGEETLDVEAVHALAPGAQVTYVASRSCDNGDFAETLNQIVDEHLADIVTNSWGGTNEDNGPPASLNKVYEQIFAQAALEGIGFYFSSGDSGDGGSANNGVPTAEAPASSPLVTAVGGTSLAIGKDGTRLWEAGWSTAKATLTGGAWSPTLPGAYQYGGGGGTSRVFAQPWYQRQVVPKALATRYAAKPARVEPDVAAIGDPNTGFLIGATQTFPGGTVKYGEYRIGGTSLASPVFAALMALADQRAGYPHGFANPALYSLAGSRALRDVVPAAPGGVVRVDYANTVDATKGTLTSLRSIDVTNGTILRVAPGYDDMTGIGSPGPAFLAALGLR